MAREGRFVWARLGAQKRYWLGPIILLIGVLCLWAVMTRQSAEPPAFLYEPY